jgi:hypothetical protein
LSTEYDGSAFVGSKANPFPLRGKVGMGAIKKMTDFKK